ncbi:hypothetical protein QL285_035311 [Trifolium repens]|nr:hypothetical protein QL285_035311 [Trifolium repens]
MLTIRTTVKFQQGNFGFSLPENFASPTQAGFLTVTSSGKSSQMDEIVTTIGTPHHVMAAKHGWYLKCCDHCSKSIITKVPPYTCIDPKHVTPNPKLKYKVEVEVHYEDHKMRTVFWDRECEELIGKRLRRQHRDPVRLARVRVN